tara:strand:+ start:47 stop:232 length:186 start_codon:yes stop_codon:yes gene_type:complete
MPAKEIDRKIAVIFATDVVNYSKHMEKDESETVKSLRLFLHIFLVLITCLLTQFIRNLFIP